MNYTKNYRLPQWVKEDRIMMDDFNAAMSSMESGMTRTAAQAAEASNKADTAVQTANSARQDVQTWKNYVVGSYTGTGAVQHIDLGFRPSFVIISGMQGNTAINSPSWINYYAITGGNALKFRVEIDSTGFTVYPKGYQNQQDLDLAEKNIVFDYIAFK